MKLTLKKQTQSERLKTIRLEKAAKRNAEEKEIAAKLRLEKKKAIEVFLEEKFPESFNSHRQPLAIGIHEEILPATTAAGFSNRLVRQVLRYWVNHPKYKKNIESNQQRIHADGSRFEQP